MINYSNTGAATQKRGRERGGRRQEFASNKPVSSIAEEVVHINRCSKVVAGGRRFSFAALVVCGDRKGSVGIGLGKAGEVADAIKKGVECAKKNMVKVVLKGTTIPHDVIGLADCGRVILRPACEGTGVVAGGAVRAVLKMVGVTNVLTKSLGSNNRSAAAKATVNALTQLRSAEEIRLTRDTDGDTKIISFKKSKKIH
jgi:small subunit ribosomal protein S5